MNKEQKNFIIGLVIVLLIITIIVVEIIVYNTAYIIRGIAIALLIFMISMFIVCEYKSLGKEE